MLTLSLLGLGAIAVVCLWALYINAPLIDEGINSGIVWMNENFSLENVLDNAITVVEGAITNVTTLVNIVESVVETTTNIAETTVDVARTGIAILNDMTAELGRGLTDEELARLIGLGRALTGVGMGGGIIYLLNSEVGQRTRTRANSRNRKENMNWHHCYEIFIKGPLVNLRIPSQFRGFTLSPLVRLFVHGPEDTRILIVPDRTKVGISDNHYLNKNGTSSRANKQVNLFNRELDGVTGHIVPELEQPYTSVILINTLPGRTAALAWELARSVQRLMSGHSMHRHLKPRNELK